MYLTFYKQQQELLMLVDLSLIHIYPKDRQKMTCTDKNAKDAITNFKVLERFKDMTLVECLSLIHI